MEDTGVIDQFLAVFSTYIDSGFGLLGGEVGFLSSTLIVIDLTIAALFWAWGTDEDIIQRLVKKTLYIGVFAFIIGNFQALAVIMLESFAGLGLKASGGAMAIGDFMRPGVVAATGIDAAQPLLDASANLVGPVGLFTNFVQIMILLIAWVIVVLAFFILAVQVFVTILEFKLVTLAGFVLLPFAFFGRTAFMAERVLGHIISSGIKVLVLAVITGIGVTLFDRFMQAGLGPEPDIEQVMAIALGALTLLGLGIFGPVDRQRHRRRRSATRSRGRRRHRSRRRRNACRRGGWRDPGHRRGCSGGARHCCCWCARCGERVCSLCGGRGREERGEGHRRGTCECGTYRSQRRSFTCSQHGRTGSREFRGGPRRSHR